jgi:pyroglutamyl-peptidase
MTSLSPIALVIGFESFDGQNFNPSQEIALRLDGETIAKHRIVGAVLPTQFAGSVSRLQALLERHDPSLIIAVGLASGRDTISIERVAINLIDARIPDNAGAQPIDEPVLADAPNAYFSTLPIKAMRARLDAAGIPASISCSAGTFVCNQVFFGLAHLLATRRRRVRGGFIHVPRAAENTTPDEDVASMPLERMIQAIRLCLDTALTVQTDMHYAAGSES